MSAQSTATRLSKTTMIMKQQNKKGNFLFLQIICLFLLMCFTLFLTSIASLIIPGECERNPTCVFAQASSLRATCCGDQPPPPLVTMAATQNCYETIFKRVVARRAVYHMLNVITISLYVRPSICMCKVGLGGGGWTCF